MSVSESQSTSHTHSPERVSVCIATCQRPVGLGNLLAALEVLDIPAGYAFQVVIVDNEPSGSARAVCDEAAARHAYPIHYMVEKNRGIPFARNAALAVALTNSDFVAFIDDDETPRSDWLSELLRVQKFYKADVVTGPCIPQYLEPPPSWVVEGGFHELPRYPTGTRRHAAYTHNVLVRTAVFESVDHYFDESMALNGGDDTEFFSRAYSEGFQIVWADNAIVHERIPASRSTVGWLVRRGFRVGTSSAWVQLNHRSSTVLHLLAHGLYCMVKGTGLALLLPLRGRAVAVRGLRLFSYGLGRIAGSSGYLHQEYGVVHGT
ncbi:MAG: glycosyltransferase family 2 protein [Deltaproteobacteria bacterium]|nr:glycosyltransferase family 2 protein [Deltaproteobacteria bacterium]